METAQYEPSTCGRMRYKAGRGRQERPDHERPCVSMLKFNPKHSKEPPKNVMRRAVTFEEITVAGVGLDAGKSGSKETAKGC